MNREEEGTLPLLLPPPPPPLEDERRRIDALCVLCLLNVPPPSSFLLLSTSVGHIRPASVCRDFYCYIPFFYLLASANFVIPPSPPVNKTHAGSVRDLLIAVIVPRRRRKSFPVACNAKTPIFGVLRLPPPSHNGAA